MNFDPEIIEQLTFLEVDGIISPEDKAYLHEIIATDKEALALYHEKRNLFTSNNLQQSVEQLDGQRYYSNVLSTIRQKRRIRVIKRAVTGIAAVSILSFALYLIFVQPNRKAPGLPDLPVPGMANNSKDGILLKTPDGHTIDLSVTKGTVAAGSTQLSNAGKTLSYTPGEDATAIALATLTVPPGKDYKLILSDGTEIWLNAATTLRFPFRFQDSREVYVSGEAYVKVSPKAEKPFRVHLPGSTVEVLGTEFNVNTYDKDQQRISLVRGMVSVKGSRDSILLKPGKEAVVGADAVAIRSFDQAYTLSWREGIYRFEEATLEQVCQILPRWFGRDVILDNPSKARTTRFTGRIDRNQGIEQTLRIMKEGGDIDYYYDKDSVLHIR